MAKNERMVSMYCSEKGAPEIVVNKGSALDLICVYLKLTTTMFRFLKENDPGFDENMAAALPLYIGTVARAGAFGQNKVSKRKTRLAVKELADALTEHISKEA